MNSSKRRFTILFLAAVLCFTLGFSTANSLHETNWIGYLVHGVLAPVSDGHEWKIYPLTHNDPLTYSFSPVVEDSVVIGLRADGVVVWKKAREATE